MVGHGVKISFCSRLVQIRRRSPTKIPYYIILFMKLLACITAIVIGLFISSVEKFEDSALKALSVVAWVIALLFTKGGN